MGIELALTGTYSLAPAFYTVQYLELSYIRILLETFRYTVSELSVIVPFMWMPLDRYAHTFHFLTVIWITSTYVITYHRLRMEQIFYSCTFNG